MHCHTIITTKGNKALIARVYNRFNSIWRIAEQGRNICVDMGLQNSLTAGVQKQYDILRYKNSQTVRVCVTFLV